MLPALAEEPKPVTNIAGPSASSSGSVVNQGVQVLNGPYMQNTYGAGVSCQTASLSVSPFVSGVVEGEGETLLALDLDRMIAAVDGGVNSKLTPGDACTSGKSNG